MATQQEVVGNFIIIGIKELVFRDRITFGGGGIIDKLVDITINDNQNTEYVRGGYGNEKLIPVYGDRDTTLEASNATISPEVLKIMMNTPQKKGAKDMQKTVEKFTLDTTVHTATLTEEPSDTKFIVVYELDQVGHRLGQIKLADNGSPNEGEYSISDKILTFPDDFAGNIAVYYTVAKENAIRFEPNDITPVSWDIRGTIVVREYESGQVYDGEIHIPNGTIQPTYSLSASNSAEVPEAIPLTIDMIKDEIYGYPYALTIDTEGREEDIFQKD